MIDIFYTGIGARETPNKIKHLMYHMARMLSESGYTLRSGAAQGSDQAFEMGCDSINGLKEIYLPWANFENSSSLNIVTNNLNDEVYKIAEKFHPYWHNLSDGAKKLQARNSYQVLGVNLSSPSNLVICYTKAGKRAGGTGQALRIAEHYNVPIFDCGLYENDLDLLKKEYLEFIRSAKKPHS